MKFDKDLENIFQSFEAEKRVLDHALLLIVTDLKGNIVKVSSRFLELTGYGLDEVLGKNPREIVNSGYHPKSFFKEMWHTVTQGGVWRGEVRNRTKLGSIYWVDSTIAVIQGRAGESLGYVAIQQDITQRKRLETELLALATFPEKNPNPVIEINFEGRVTYLNPAAKQLFPELESSLSYHPILTDIKSVLGEFQKNNKKLHVREIKTDQRVYEQHIYYVPESQRLKTYLFDVTERVKLNQFKDEFISNVSHEMRTPLSIIKLAVNNLEEEIAGPLVSRQKNFLQVANRNIERLSRIINDLLDIAKLESGHVTLDKRTVNLADLLEETLEHFQNLGQEKGIFLEKNFPPRLILSVDVNRVAQVLNNLLANAIRYAKKKITLKAALSENDVQVSITDDGPGISADAVGRLFTKFVQINRPEGPGYKGTGLGLVICKDIIDLHGGKIWIESIPGQGATFHFTLPLTEEKRVSKRKAIKITEKKRTPTIAPLEKRKILVVDDEQEIVQMIKTSLERANYEVETATDGLAGLQKAQSFRPDVIILDILMPEMDGWEVCRRLKADLRTKDIAIMLFTVLKSKEFEERARIVKADLVIPKVVELGEFMRLLEDLIEKKQINPGNRD